MSQSFFGQNQQLKRASTGNLSKSTYVPNDQAFKAISNKAATGKSIIGGTNLSPTAVSKINSLAMLLDSEDDFGMAFAVKHSEAKTVTKPSRNHD
jgi:hypothetical protein